MLLADNFSNLLERFFVKSLEQESSELFLIEQDDQIKAFCVLSRIPDRPTLRKVSSFTVPIEEQKFKWGTKPMRWIQSHSETEKVNLFGWTHQSFTVSMKFYLSLGVQPSLSASVWPEKPWDCFPSGWICLWYPRFAPPITLDQKNPERFCMILKGKESPVTIGIEASAKLIATKYEQDPRVKVVKNTFATEINFSELEQYMKLLQNRGTKRFTFYYVGHGRASNNGGDYPSFMSREGNINLIDIHNLCVELFQFSVVVADCCNSIPATDYPPVAAEDEVGPYLVDPFDGEGHLIISSSERTQVSWGLPTTGLFFTEIFMKHFNGDWIGNLNRMQHHLGIKCRSHNVSPQIPQWTKKNFKQDIIQLPAKPVAADDEQQKIDNLIDLFES